MRALMINIIKLGLILGPVLLVWAVFVEPNLLEVKKYKMPAKGLQGIKIVFLSDLHLAPSHGKKLQKIVAAVNGQKPDIILLGGDYVKGHKGSASMKASDIAAGLSHLKAKHGIYAVLGNHDGWYNAQSIEQEFSKQNIRILKNKNIAVKIKEGTSFYLVGLEDYYTGKPDMVSALKETKNPVMVLSHSPDVFPDVPSSVDLTLAGHTHGGQVKLPFWGAILTSSIYGTKYAEGFIEQGGKKMIVTKGIGTSLLPLRFNCRPEIVVIEFE